MTSLSARKCTFVVIATALFCAGCNLTGFMDSPSDDAQYLSAARACLDRGDFQCAMDNYGKVSSANTDVATSEMAITQLDEQGATMSAFMDFVADLGQYNTGVAITKFVEKLIPNAGEAKRVAIWTAYNSRNSISNSELKSFVQFAGGLSLAAEILAEAGDSATQQLFQSNLATNPSSCISSGGISANCNGPSSGYGSNLTATPSQPDPTTTSPTNTNPTLQQFMLALGDAGTGLGNLSPSGRFQSAASIFAQLSKPATISALNTGGPNSAADEGLRYLLITQNIGE